MIMINSVIVISIEERNNLLKNKYHIDSFVYSKWFFKKIFKKVYVCVVESLWPIISYTHKYEKSATVLIFILRILNTFVELMY